VQNDPGGTTIQYGTKRTKQQEIKQQQSKNNKSTITNTIKKHGQGNFVAVAF